MKTRTDPSVKPYYRCLSCAKFRKACSGIPTRDLDLKSWCEYMRDVKEIAHLTNAYIAEKADVSLKRIEQIMALNCDQDVMRSTARRIEQVVIGTVGKHFCDLDYDSTASDHIASLLLKIDHLRKENARYAAVIDAYMHLDIEGECDKNEK